MHAVDGEDSKFTDTIPRLLYHQTPLNPLRNAWIKDKYLNSTYLSFVNTINKGERNLNSNLKDLQSHTKALQQRHGNCAVMYLRN